MRLLHRLRKNRVSLSIGLLGLTALIAVGFWATFALLRSLPQRTVVMAIYPEGSLNAKLAKRYREVLARRGIDLRLAPSAGAVESLAQLRDPKSTTTVALIPGGITTEQESPQVVSLGTVFYQPMWIFSRRHLLDGHHHPKHLRISIGPEGSSSHALSLKLLERSGLIDAKSASLFPLAPSVSADKLMSGEIDAAIFLDGWESPVVQQLINNKHIHLESIPRADAFDALYPYLDKLILPAGVIDMSRPEPPTDVQLIATKSSLVVRRDLHPAIQYMLLEAAVEIHSPPGMFRTAGQFPAPESIDLPLSPYAREFYKTGTPFLLRHLPFWLAVVLAQPLVWLIPVAVLLIPVLRLAPAVYDWAERMRIYKFYSELKRLEDEMLNVAPGLSRDNFLEQLNRLDDRASRLSVPASFKPLLYSLRLHIDVVRKAAQKTTVEHWS